MDTSAHCRVKASRRRRRRKEALVQHSTGPRMYGRNAHLSIVKQLRFFDAVSGRYVGFIPGELNY
jgi:hypothetical protein